MSELRMSFRPEFLNRLDEIVFYKPLTKDVIFPIIDLMLDELRSRLKSKQLSLKVTDDAKTFIMDEGYNPIYGARPLKRFIQKHLETLIAKHIITNDIPPYTTLTINYSGSALTIS
jgi:ATP-dependent Clp protease ATP-binding subunit ClpB